jgi:hypothetical protein
MTMDTSILLIEASDDKTEGEREIIRQSLNEIALEVKTRLREANLSYPVYLSVPLSGDAIITLFTRLDPSDEQWDRVSEIIRQILSARLGGMRLRSRHLICAVADALVEASEIIGD